MLKPVMEKVLVIGSGMTGASVATLLRQNLKKTATISLWDKSNGLGKLFDYEFISTLDVDKI